MVSSDAARRGSLAGGLLKAGKDPGPLGRRRRGGWHSVATVIISEYGAVVPGWLILPVSGSRQRVRDSRRGHCRKKWSITVIATSSFEQHGETIAAEPVPAPGNDRFRVSQSLFKEGRSGFQSNHDPLRLAYFRLPGDPVPMRLDLPITVYQ